MYTGFDKTYFTNGMHVITKCGKEYVFLIHINATEQSSATYTDRILVGFNEKNWLNFNKYNNDLTLGEDCFDIQKVYAPKYFRGVFCSVKDYPDEFDLVWKRPEKKKMTLEEVEKKLGYEIEIIE